MLMRCVAPNLWGWLGDRSGQRLAIVRFGAVCTALGFSLIFVSHSYAWLALVMALHAFFWHAVLPQFEVITLAHLRERSASYSRIRLWGSDRFHLHRGRSRRAVRAPEPGCLPGDAAGYHARHRAVQLVGAQCPAGPSRTARRRGRLPRPVAPAGRAGVLPVRVPDAVVPWAVLHLPDPAPGIAGLQPGADRSALGAGVVAEVMLFLAMPRLLQRFSLRQVLAASSCWRRCAGCFSATWPTAWRCWSLPRRCMPPPSAVFMRLPSISCNVASARASRARSQALYAALAGTGGALGALYSGYSWNSLGPAWTFAIASLAALLAAAIISTRLQEVRA